ncbi:MAG: hypothetical protein WCP45_09785, partial [Verrucomicrobiota bacterium]
MKPKHPRLFHLRHIALVVSAAAAVTTVQAATNTWTSTTSGNWSTAAKWDVKPLTDGTADVHFAAGTAAVTATIDSAWAAAGAVNSLTFDVATAGSYILAGGTGVTGLTLGAGGLANSSSRSVSLTGPAITLGASQTWTDSGGGITVNTHLASASGVALTLPVTGLTFTSGNSTNLLGPVVWNAGTITCGDPSQHGRLGAGNITANFTGVTVNPGYVFNMTNGSETPATSTVANNVALTIPSTRYLVLQLNNANNVGQNMVFSGNWSGTIASNQNAFGAISFNLGMSCYDDRFRFTFSGDNSGLTSTADASVNNYVFYIRKGCMVVNSPTAMGVNNALAVGVGESNASVGGVHVGLLATTGNDVNAKIRVRNDNLTTARNTYAVLGLDGAGAVNFKGPLFLEGLSGQANGVETLQLTAPASGTATFSGNITDFGDTYRAPVLVMGAGSVRLSGTNAYAGTTTVREGNLLVGSAAALGSASSTISLGDAVTQTTDVVAASNVDMPNVTSFSAGVYTLTVALTTLDGVTIHSGDRILYKSAAGISTPEKNGIYTVDSTLKILTRATDLDESAEFVKGLRVHVTGGTRNGGKNFFLSSDQAIMGSGITFTVNSTTTGNGTVAFSPDADTNVGVAILTEGAFTVARNINVTNNLSTGKSSLGGNSAHASTFSGAIALARDLTVTAASGGSATFS